MKSAILFSALVAAVTADVTTNTTVQTTEHTCLAACTPGDVNCEAGCVGVPHPGAAEMEATAECVLRCVDGDSPEFPNDDNYALCQIGCISSHITLRTTAPSATSILRFGGSTSDALATPSEKMTTITIFAQYPATVTGFPASTTLLWADYLSSLSDAVSAMASFIGHPGGAVSSILAGPSGPLELSAPTSRRATPIPTTLSAGRVGSSLSAAPIPTSRPAVPVPTSRPVAPVLTSLPAVSIPASRPAVSVSNSLHVVSVPFSRPAEPEQPPVSGRIPVELFTTIVSGSTVHISLINKPATTGLLNKPMITDTATNSVFGGPSRAVIATSSKAGGVAISVNSPMGRLAGLFLGAVALM